ncbi:MAG TPA: Gfo/Idh/MocA family oxidoreductase [Polyangiaceae bacterium]|nr:Gfo/Idh/MocA family oxidoreductase [Polyangiaceae bacterium]
MTDFPPSNAPRDLRGAIVGYGFIAERGHAPAYALPGETRFQIVAIADGCAARREKAHAAFPQARIYEGHEQLLEAERGRIDFVDVATPPCDHARVATHALSRGLHVLCEKPLATTAADARRMLARARDSRRVLFPSHNYKHAPVVKAVRRVLDQGAIGAVRLVTLQTFRTTHAKGVDEWRRDWRRERRFSGGGIAMDHGSHTFYLAFDWLGGYPTSISAKMSTLGVFDTEDNFSCSMTFPHGTASAHLSWTAGVRKVLYTIHGERGAIRVEDDDVEVAIMKEATSRTASPTVWETHKLSVSSDWMDASHVGWFRSLFDQFAGAIAREDFVSPETEASLGCVELITAAYESAFDGSRERLLAARAERAA